MKRCYLWLVSLDTTSGHERQDTRPILDVSLVALDELAGKPVELPISGMLGRALADFSSPNALRAKAPLADHSLSLRL